MKKPRVIIADTEQNYIIPLQMKFVEDFFGKIDLEIITERAYFTEMFSMPQTADLLIVSEDLYSADLQRHSIGNIFLMMERDEGEQVPQGNTLRLFKYSSIKEIFRKIIAKSGDILNTEGEAKRGPQIIMVYSPVGGVGRTTLAMGISSCLARDYKRVLYINADRMQYFQAYMENPAAISSANVYVNLMNPTESSYLEVKHAIRKEGFSYLPPFKAPLLVLGLPYSVYESIALGAKNSGEYDYIIVDADSAFDEYKTKLMDIADKVLVVTDQTKRAVYATNILASNINGINSEKYCFICNNFDPDADNALLSPQPVLRFSVNDYVSYIPQHGKTEDVAKDSAVRKVTFLVM